MQKPKSIEQVHPREMQLRRLAAIMALIRVQEVCSGKQLEQN